MASQVAFGVVAGLVVLRQERVSTRENLPFAMRAGVEAPGIMAAKRREDDEMKHLASLASVALVLSIVLCGCANAPGRELAASTPIVPTRFRISAFSTV